MVHPTLIEMQNQSDREERNRYWRKTSAIHDMQLASRHSSVQPQTRLSGLWRIVQDRLCLRWENTRQTP